MAYKLKYKIVRKLAIERIKTMQQFREIEREMIVVWRLALHVISESDHVIYLKE